MAGNYALPYRLPPGGSIVYSHPNHMSGCDTAPHWQNVTRVRAADGATPPTIGSVAPFPRNDTTFDGGPEGPNTCPTSPPGTCGAWIMAGDLLGLSAQEITDTVNDILACGAAPVVSYDHNCYSQSGRLSFKKCHKIGGKWNVAQKMWHGVLGLNDRNDPTPIASVSCATGSTDSGGGYFSSANGFNNAAPQVRYLTSKIEGSRRWSVSGTFNPLTPPTPDTSSSVSATATVGRYSGIQSFSSEYTPDPQDYIDASEIFTLLQGLSHDSIIGMFEDRWFTNTFLFGVATGTVAASGPNSWTFTADAGDTWTTAVSTISIDPGGSCSRTVDIVYNAPGFLSTTYTLRESVVWGNTGLTYNYSYTITDQNNGTSMSEVDSGSVTLSDPYTSADCYSDWQALMAQWDLTSDTLYPFRTDEELANAPLMVFDEVGPSQPTPTYGTMNDYSQAQNGDGSWPQRPMLDPNNYTWQTPSGGFEGFPIATGGNILKTPLRSGAMVTHNAAGSDRHFWFNFAKTQRLEEFDNPGTYIWYITEHGGYSDGLLPTATVRWQDQQAAQFDYLASIGDEGTPADGNLPQAWLREKGSVLTGGKYIEAKEIWQSVNFGRPYGLDKFAVDQTTVQCVTGAGPYTITPTNNATNPLVTGVAMLGGSGIYNITVSGTSMTLGTKLSEIPDGADLGAGYAGMMRFWAAPPFGLLACAATYDGTTNTNFVMPATPYWLALSGNPTLSVDLYAPDAGNGNPHASAGSAVTLTKYGAWAAGMAFATGQKILVGQQIFTATSGGTSGGSAPTWNPTLAGTTMDGTVTWTTGGMVPVGAVAYAVGDKHTAAFLIPHLHFSGGAFKPEYDDNRPKGDFVQMQWLWNNRAAQTGYTGTVPTWNGANLGSGQPTILPVNIQSQNIRLSPCCPAVIGFVPFYSPLVDSGSGQPSDPQPPPSAPRESFRNQQLFPMPGTFQFDDSFFAYWIGVVQTTMVDPFWQAPFAPDCTGAFQWIEDDGSGQPDSGDEDDPPFIRYYPARPLVEARATYPANLGWAKNEGAPTLPGALSLAFDVTKNLIMPEVGPPGIPIGDVSGGFGSVWTAYGFYLKACANIAGSGRFGTTYSQFVSC